MSLFIPLQIFDPLHNHFWRYVLLGLFEVRHFRLRIDFQFFRNQVDHMENPRDLVFGDKTHLQIQILAILHEPAHASLIDQHQHREKNPLERRHPCKMIETQEANSGKPQEPPVKDNPTQQQERVGVKETHATDDRDQVADELLVKAARTLRLSLCLKECFDIAIKHSGERWFLRPFGPISLFVVHGLVLELKKPL